MQERTLTECRALVLSLFILTINNSVANKDLKHSCEWMWIFCIVCMYGFVGFVLALVENIERHPMPKWLLFTPLTNKRKLWDIGVTKGDNTCSWKKVQVVHKREQNNRKNYIYLLGTLADEFIYSLTLTMVELSMFLEKLESSTIHGLAHISTSRRKLVRIFWIIVVITAMTIAGI